MTAPSPAEILQRIRRLAPWLLAPELGTCVVGSTALAEACRRAGIPGPEGRDLDLAWATDPDAGATLLDSHGVRLPTTPASVARGTLAMRLGDQRVEITSFRAGDPTATFTERLRADLTARDMTIGAVAWHLARDRIVDPLGGVAHWRERRIVPVGDPAQRVEEHPVRWLRYYRKAHQLGFELATAIRKLRPSVSTLARIPAEAVAAELRAALADLASPGRFLLELCEARGLEHLAPELAGQLDGRPAGPARHHPEVGQALHLILALEWAASRSRHLSAQGRMAVMLAVLCHDLGKGDTPPDALPSHHGHEHAGVPMVRRLFERLPGLGDAAALRLCEQVALLHLTARNLRGMRSGSLARLYEKHLRRRDFPVEPFALAVGADVGGRLGMAAAGDDTARQVAADIAWLRAACETVDVERLRHEHCDVDAFREALHEARARAIRAATAR